MHLVLVLSKQFLGSSLVSLPSSESATEVAARMMIPLHSVAIVGYISLIVNAMNVLPIGSKLFLLLLVVVMFAYLESNCFISFFNSHSHRWWEISSVALGQSIQEAASG